MARSEWETVQDMLYGKFTEDAKFETAVNRREIESQIKEFLELHLEDVDERLVKIQAIRPLPGGRMYQVRYTYRDLYHREFVTESQVPAEPVRYTKDSPAVQRYFDRIRNAPNNQKALQAISKEADNDDGLSSAELKEVQARIVYKAQTGRSSYDAKVKDAQAMSIHHQKFGDITARIVSSLPGGFFYTGYVSNGYKLYRNAAGEFVATKLHFDKPTREGLANYFNADSKVEKWTDAWNEFDRIRRRLEPDWQAIMKEVKKLYDRHRGDPNWDEGYRRFIGN